ncbi:MAG: ketoacyl-ACP synthase III, partial [Anaerolineae bacterium]|nr:ketoacyl-ACP synthase III [Anaerolineae bacterium]
QALAKADMLPDEIELIIVATSTPYYYFPSTACLIQDKLGATNAGAFDIVAACTGFIYALGLASAQIKAGGVNTALIIGTETLSRIMDWQDRSTCILFGDGAGAFVLKVSDAPGGIQDVVMHSDGSGADLLYASTGIRETWDGDASEQRLYMNGREVFRFATRVMASATHEVVAKAGLTLDDIDVIVPHQANQRIIQAAAKTMKLPMERFFVNLDHYGNTSAASIPLAIGEAVEKGAIKAQDKIVLVGFGAGLTWGAALLEWDSIEEPPRSAVRELVRSAWYILARMRSFLSRVLRFLERVIFRPPGEVYGEKLDK